MPQIVPDIEAMGGEGQTGVPLVAPIPIMVKLVWETASANCVSAGHGTGTAGQGQGNALGSKDGQGSTSNKKDPSSLQCFQCQGWGHMAQECATPARLLNQTRGD